MNDKNHQQIQTPEITPTLSLDMHTSCTRQFQVWLDLPNAREQRRFLENHLELLGESCETILQELFAQEAEKPMQTQREALMVLQDTRRRGGTVEAVREAYVNLYGGFVLDLPPWLEEVEQRLTDLTKHNRVEGTAETRIRVVQDALEKIHNIPELLATLYYQLALAWWKYPRANSSQALEKAINLFEEVLQIFTITRYPYQHALTQNALGNIYQPRIAGERRENLERAISCYHKALHIHTFEAFPSQYALVQNNLGVTYFFRITGERRENLERAISCYHEALRVHTLGAFPAYYARIQNNLGIVYSSRIVGKRSENLEQAIIFYHETLRIWTVDAFPFDYARVQNNLGIAYKNRIEGERRENLEQAIACFHKSLRIKTRDAFPFYYAMVQTNLGNVYKERIEGERRENLEQAIVCFREALYIYTRDAFPFYYAEVQDNLGSTYKEHIDAEQQENQAQAIACFHQALCVYTIEAFPREFRNMHLSIAETEAQRGNWNAVQDTYTTALKAEDLLIILGTGTLGRDAILKEGRDAALRQGYTLHRLGRIDEAAIAIERGRALGLAEAIAFDAADPTLITDEARRSHYIIAREELIKVQADLHTPLSQDLDENTRRRLDLERTETYRQAKAAFDALVTQIREANDPADFLNDTIDASTILQVASQAGSGHGFAYLVATPWGGVAVAVLGEQEASSAHFAALNLPDLTEAFINSLIETRLHESSQKLLGGFALAQRGVGFEQMCMQWEGETFQEKAQTLQSACHNSSQESTLDQAAQATLDCSPCDILAKQPLAQLERNDYTLLAATFDAFFLQQELTRCLHQLSTTVMHPLILWIQQQGATSLTLIPCGHLAAFPLTAVLLPDGHSVGETIPTSVAPSVRSLLQTTITRSPQAGMVTLGDPQNNLPWSEAEALTLTALARRAALPAEVYLKQQATRDHLLSALSSRWMVNACCHGTFDAQDFLQSSLHLAHNERVTMAEMLNHQADLRGLRLLLLSACQTGLLDLEGACDEGHSLAAAMVQAGARAVLATQWAVDDKATYLLMVRFIQEWLPQMEREAPASALARAQAWLRTITNAELAVWQRTMSLSAQLPMTRSSQQGTTPSWQRIPVRGRSARWQDDEAQLIVRIGAEQEEPSTRPYADPYYWAGFQVIGW